MSDNQYEKISELRKHILGLVRDALGVKKIPNTFELSVDSSEDDEGQTVAHIHMKDYGVDEALFDQAVFQTRSALVAQLKVAEIVPFDAGDRKCVLWVPKDPNATLTVDGTKLPYLGQNNKKRKPKP